MNYLKSILKTWDHETGLASACLLQFPQQIIGASVELQFDGVIPLPKLRQLGIIKTGADNYGGSAVLDA
jgi:hypothetical protein